MYKRILVAIDDSSTSRRALRESVRLAREQKSLLRIVHVLDLVASINAESSHALAEYEASARRSGARILKRASAVADKAGVRSTTRLLEVRQLRDRIADEIARDAANARAGLIVIGTHGRRGVSRLFVGSVAEAVIRIAPVPVLLIRGD